MTRKGEKLAEIPPVLQELIDLIGRDAAMNLIRIFGGTPLWIPTYTNSGAVYERIAEVVGYEAADKLVARYSGDRITIPRGHRIMVMERWRKIIADYNRGDTTLIQLALRYQMTERQISIILKKPL